MKRVILAAKKPTQKELAEKWAQISASFHEDSIREGCSMAQEYFPDLDVQELAQAIQALVETIYTKGLIRHWDISEEQGPGVTYGDQFFPLFEDQLIDLVHVSSLAIHEDEIFLHIFTSFTGTSSDKYFSVYRGGDVLVERSLSSYADDKRTLIKYINFPRIQSR